MSSRRILRLTLFSAWIFMVFPFLFSNPAHAAQIVRVLVAENQTMVKVNIAGDYRVRALPSMEIIKAGSGLKNAWLVPTPNGIRMGKQEWSCRGVRVEPAKDRDLVLNRSRFRGSAAIFKDGRNQFYSINILDIESYLYGVLHHEVAAWWPMEALKAQAVAARTYALHEMLVSRSAEYDLKSDTSSQVFGGSTTERYRTKRAVNLTHGQALTFDGKVFAAYFHATCGGLTAGASELWKYHLPPVGGGVECGFCRISPHYYWEARVALAEVEEKLNKYGRPVGQVLKIELVTQTPSHRVGSIKITGTKNEVVVAAKDFRVWIGGNKLRSTAFTVEIHDDMVRFRGRGWGHGVGLCQWGTLGQALAGKKYQDILQLYYPGSQIKNISSASDSAVKK